jgi:hypothetical protein
MGREHMVNSEWEMVNGERATIRHLPTPIHPHFSDPLAAGVVLQLHSGEGRSERAFHRWHRCACGAGSVKTFGLAAHFHLRHRRHLWMTSRTVLCARPLQSLGVALSAVMPMS